MSLLASCSARERAKRQQAGNEDIPRALRAPATDTTEAACVPYGHGAGSNEELCEDGEHQGSSADESTTVGISGLQPRLLQSEWPEWRNLLVVYKTTTCHEKV